MKINGFMDGSVFYRPEYMQNTDQSVKSAKIMQNAQNFQGSFVTSIYSNITSFVTRGEDLMHLLALQYFNDLVCKLSHIMKNLLRERF